MEPIKHTRTIYEIYVRSFFDSNADGIGDLRGVTMKLDYLQDLGIDTIWLTPIFESPNYDFGYDVSNYYQINPEYGQLEDLLELLKEAHDRNIRVLLDLVLNHCSYLHPWFQSALSEPTSKYRDYFLFQDQIPNNLGCQFESSAWHQTTDGQYYLGLFSKYQPDFNWRNPALRKDLFDIVRYYLNLGVDGFRFDVLSLIQKPLTFHHIETEKEFADFKSYSNYPGIETYLLEISKLLREYDAISIGEGSGLTNEEGLLYSDYLTYMLTFGLMDLDGSETNKFTKQPFDLTKVKNLLEENQKLYHGKSSMVLFCENHDQPRIASRISSNGHESKAAKAFATILYGMEGTRLLFQGQEIGMTNYPFLPNEIRDVESVHAYQTAKDKHLMMEIINQKSRDHGRTPMQWSKKVYAGFSTHLPWMGIHPNYPTLNVESEIEDPTSVFNYYKKLLQMTKDMKGKVDFLKVDFPLIGYRREQYLVIANWSDKPTEVKLDLHQYQIILNSENIVSNDLLPWQSLILKERVIENNG